MKARRRIKAKEIVADVRSKMTSQQLIEKYAVSPNQLQSVFRLLLDARAIVEEDLHHLLSTPNERLDITKKRQQHRSHVFVQLPIYDLENLLNQGTVVDFSEKGLRISGIPANEGDTKEFLVQADYFADVYPFVFEACCQWLTTENEQCLTGFRISKITDGSLIELRKLIRMLTLTD